MVWYLHCRNRYISWSPHELSFMTTHMVVTCVCADNIDAASFSPNANVHKDFDRTLAQNPSDGMMVLLDPITGQPKPVIKYDMKLFDHREETTFRRASYHYLPSTAFARGTSRPSRINTDRKHALGSRHLLAMPISSETMLKTLRSRLEEY